LQNFIISDDQAEMIWVPTLYHVSRIKSP